MRSWSSAFAVLLVVLPWCAQALSDPALQLQRLQPQLFTSSNTQSAAFWGEQAVRLVELTPALEDVGFQLGDVILAVAGQALGGDTLSLPQQQTVYTVARQVSGQRPVLDAATVGRRMLVDFGALDAPERTPMRLTRMVSNAWTLMREGWGVLLLPKVLGAEDDTWLQFATPLPVPSEDGVRKVAQGVTQRAELPVVPDEAEAARRAFEQDDVLVAKERASRAVLQWIVEPQNRRASRDFTALVQLYRDATKAVAERRVELLRPAPRFGAFVEGSFSFVQKMLPQETLIAVENSNGLSLRGGLRTRMFRWLDVLLSYGIVDNDFEDAQGRTKIATSLQPALFELAYRPVVLSRLKPVLRAGIGWYRLDTSVLRDDGVAAFEDTKYTWGTEFGGGIDAFYWKSKKLRGTVMASFRLLEYTFPAARQDPNDGIDYPTENWPDAANLPPGSSYNPDEPLDFLQPRPQPGYLPHYTYNLNGWMLGFMLTRDF